MKYFGRDLADPHPPTVVDITDRFRVLTAVANVLDSPGAAGAVIEALPTSARVLLADVLDALDTALRPPRADTANDADDGDGGLDLNAEEELEVRSV